MNSSNFNSRIRQFIDKRKAMKQNPVLPVKTMPMDMAKIFAQVRKEARRNA